MRRHLLCVQPFRPLSFPEAHEDEVLADHGIAQADLMKAQIFFVKDKFIARAWGGYTSTKRTGNEAGDTANGVGDSDPSKGYNGI